MSAVRGSTGGLALAVAQGSDRRGGQGKAATNGDKIICLLFPIAWPIVRFVGGRTGAGQYALGGIGIGLFLSATGAC